MKNMYFSLKTVLSIFTSSVLASTVLASTALASTVLVSTVLVSSVASASATTDELCVESAATSIIRYLQTEEPGAKIALVRDSQGALVGLTDENGIFDDLEFSNVFEDEPNTHIYEFRDGDFIVFATVTMFAPNGALACIVTDVDSGQDDQD